VALRTATGRVSENLYSDPFMPDRNRRNDDIDHPLDRSTDKSPFQVLNAKIAEYRTIIYLIIGFLAWMGWKAESPSARTAKVEQRVANVEDSISVVKDTIAQIRRGQIATHSALEVLVRLRCFDSTLSSRDMKLAGLDCSDIDNARRVGRR
jgi:hypothetical protein